jgi:CheY-like chemotaxis protein
VLRVVTTNNTEIFRHLGSRAVKVAGVEHAIATDYASALALTRSMRPKLCILDVELPGGDGYSLCRAIKDDPTLGGPRVMLVLTSVVTRPQLLRLQQSGCDDVLALPLHSEDFFHHLARVGGLDFRRHERVDVSLDIEIEGGAGSFRGTVANLSMSGLAIECQGRLEAGSSITVRLIREGRRFPDTEARVAWARPQSDGNVRAGLAFVNIPLETKLLVEDLCLFQVKESESGELVVSLHGDITERADFSSLVIRLAAARVVEFNMRETRYFSSAGVRSWCRFLEQLAGRTYWFRHTSLAFTSQVAMVPMAAGTGEIHSFEAPYLCERCDREDVRLLERDAVLHDGDEIVPPTFTCNECQGPLIFDDVPHRYLAFLL